MDFPSEERRRDASITGGADDRAAQAGEDTRCVRRVLGGDRGAFRPLVERYERAVRSFLLRQLGNDFWEAEDLTQETFVRAYQYLDRLADPARFAAWLFQIARSLCRDRRRRRAIEKRAIERRLEMLSSYANDEDSGASELASALDELPAREARVLRLRYFEGYTYEEIAERMELSFGKVDHLIRKARAALARKAERDRERERSL
jgi:RNA polymerase sigma-70 factor (ECF subfamily)